MKKGEHVSNEGIEVPSGEKITEIDFEQVYKYLGILEADRIKDKLMKENIKTEYLRRLKVLLKLHLNSKNVIDAINSGVIFILR